MNIIYLSREKPVVKNADNDFYVFLLNEYSSRGFSVEIMLEIYVYFMLEHGIRRVKVRIIL